MDSVVNLWGDEFSVAETPLQNKELLKKAASKKELVVSKEKQLKSKKLSVEEKMILIAEDVDRILGSYRPNTVVIKSSTELQQYINSCLENGIMSIDTETGDENGYGSLNTFDCNLMGLCLYTPGQKNAYIPVSHVDSNGRKLSWQVTEQQIKNQLERCNKVFKVFHNATFDIEVIQTTCDIKLHADWDTMVGAQVLNENEPKGLKTQYKLHINSEQDKYDIEHLFRGLPYSIFDPKLFALYAATDAFETYQLYLYQKRELEKPENKDVYNLFKTIEIPILDVVVDMELEGVEVDLDYAKRLSEVYHKKSDAVQAKVDVELKRLKPVIDAWRLTPEANIQPLKSGWKYVSASGGPGDMPYWIGPDGKQYDAFDHHRLSKSKSEQLTDPPELSSPTQMAILLYDVLKVPVVDPKTPRGTGADILKELGDQFVLCKLLDEKRGYDKLLDTFIDKMAESVQKDGRIHARFNTCGTATGRFSSSDPNLQNIPSHAKDVRLIFRAPKGYSIIGSDYSGQEMRVLASASNDEAMISAYENNQDIYAKVASLVYKNDYEDNLEFRPGTGEKQPEGKERRSKAKVVALGLNYGMSTKSLAERLGTAEEDAQRVVDGYYGGLTGVKKYTEQSQAMLKQLGYVTDLFGRRRHIPDAQLPQYEIVGNAGECDFNPLIGAVPHQSKKQAVLIEQYRVALEQARRKRDKDAIIAQAKKDGLSVTYNGSAISRAMRQCLNSRIQGSSASMTKLAMIKAHNDPELRRLGFKLLFTVHDEFAGMSPTENSQRCGERLCEIMVEAAKVKCSNVPWKCDPYVVKHWYLDELSAEVLKDYTKLVDKTGDQSEALRQVIDQYSALNPKYVTMMCHETFDVNLYEDV